MPYQDSLCLYPRSTSFFNPNIHHMVILRVIKEALLKFGSTYEEICTSGDRIKNFLIDKWSRTPEPSLMVQAIANSIQLIITSPHEYSVARKSLRKYFTEEDIIIIENELRLYLAPDINQLIKLAKKAFSQQPEQRQECLLNELIRELTKEKADVLAYRGKIYKAPLDMDLYDQFTMNMIRLAGAVKFKLIDNKHYPYSHLHKFYGSDQVNVFQSEIKKFLLEQKVEPQNALSPRR